MNSRNENDGGWDTFMKNTEVLYATLFTPRPSNIAFYFFGLLRLYSTSAEGL